MAHLTAEARLLAMKAMRAFVFEQGLYSRALLSGESTDFFLAAGSRRETQKVLSGSQGFPTELTQEICSLGLS